MNEAASRSAWSYGRFRIFASGNAINNLGESMYALTIPLLAFKLTGSLQSMALLAAVYPLVITVSGPLVGTAVDRFGSKAFVLPGLVLQIMAVLGLNLVLLVGTPSIWILGAAEMLVQLGAVAYRAGWMAGVPSMFPDYPARARGALSTSYQATVVLGPAVAAALIAPIGFVGLLWINLLTFFPPVVVWLIGINPVEAQEHIRSVSWNILADLREGWATLRASRKAYVVILVLVPLNLIFGTGSTALILNYLRGDVQLTAGDAGLVIAAANVGAFFGAFFVAERPRRSIGAVCTVGLLGSAICFYILPGTQVIPVVVVALILLYLLNTAVEVAADMVIYSTIPEDALGRALGFYRLILGIPAFISPLIIALVAVWAGSRGAFLMLGTVALLPGIWLLLTRGRVFGSDGPSTSAPVVGNSPREGT